MTLPIIYYLLPTLLLAIPLGKLLAHLTTHEPQIYNTPIYFPTIQKLLLITAAITLPNNPQIFLTTTFLAITIQSWTTSSKK